MSRDRDRIFTTTSKEIILYNFPIFLIKNKLFLTYKKFKLLNLNSDGSNRHKYERI